MEKEFFVYIITNEVNGKSYIGKCTDHKERWRRHLIIAQNGPSDLRFQIVHRAIRKYGKENFTFKILETWPDEPKALAREVCLIDKYNTFKGAGYNCTSGGEGISGFRFSDEAKQKMSRTRKGKFTGADHHSFGKKHKPKTIEKLRENNHKKKRYIDFIQAEQMRKFYHSDKSLSYKDVAKAYLVSYDAVLKVISFRRKYSEDLAKSKYPKKDFRNRGGIRNLTEKGRHNLSRAAKNRITSEETKEKISKANRKFTDEIERQIYDLYCKILSAKKVAKLFGCSKSTIQRIVRSYSGIYNLHELRRLIKQ